MDQKLESGKVCVTGASGFLASWLIKRLLLSGYHVTGTVRDPGNQKKLAHLWRLEGARERLRLVKADLMEEGSFDDAVLGCHGVFHTASPTEILEPAVEGTLNVLRSCKKNPSLRRVVLTSSSSTVRVRPDEDFDSNIPLDESSWSSVELCETLQIWYPLSKILAEKAAWDFCKENGIDLVTVLPSFVIGPCLPPDLCSTASDVLGLLKAPICLNNKAGETEKFKWHGRMGYVHIDDVALCHISVYEHESAHGRYLCSSTVLDNNVLASLLSRQYPSLPIPKRRLRTVIKFNVYMGIFRFEQLGRPRYDLNTSKLKSLGFKFKTIQEMFDDCIASLGMDQKLESGKVCVTGASGFLASWLIKRLLLSGYHVTGTVRDPDYGHLFIRAFKGNQKKLAHLWRLEGARERLRLVKADLIEEGSFDDAILGCHGVFHSASPTEILEPAVEGTLNVLRSCKKNPSLRRVVLTSSSSAVRVRPDEDFDSNTPLDESSWSSVELCEILQFKFCHDHHQIHIKSYGLCEFKFKWLGRMGYVHIDDVAICHILVYEHESANGRYLCSSTVLDNNELASLLSKQYPSLPIPKNKEGPYL
ncbi:dihydroflavonol 4-reductase-like1 [Prunus dulcis]|uniref:Bifunctional dihydroflavonol 4-reductase/flavanone 4-reductase n=1 Tax=Prunus dulcis TaxID=3755 RepID=A0A4Y1S161_PRUDU|nr:dihydroflavonol 4-reductase-like1 [Prunus dulcis]